MREEVKWWFETAKINLRRAERAFNAEDYEECAFWAHQTVEFALKVLIIFLGESPPKTRNLRRLYESVRKKISLDEQLLAELTPYYSVSRYPDIFMGVPNVHKNTAKKFLDFAKEVIRIIGEKIGFE
ncbi:MAG: HEPN domain-containing protein [Candidatus Njordarchaeales archaeon]